MRRVALLVAVALLSVAPSGAASSAPSVPTAPSAPASAAPDTSAFEDLGTWIDIYDPAAFDNPAGAVAQAQKHGVATIFVETSNYSRSRSVMNPAALAQMIKAAHARGMQVVAWYLPGFLKPARDFKRSVAAINFDVNGQSFDAFGLDIESSALKSVDERSKRLIALSRRIDESAPANYPLAAIIPSPRGMQLVKGYWDNFPYTDIAPYYDVWMPMTYYTYRVSGRQAVYDYTRLNAQILHDELADPSLPIHQIGGIADRSSGIETAGFVDAVLDDGLLGGGLYDMRSSGREDWRQLQRLVP